MLVAASPPPSFDPQQFIDQNVKQCGNGIALKCNIRGTVDSIKGVHSGVRGRGPLSWVFALV